MIYKYRVTLEGIKGFYRLYHINSGSSLYTFHKQLRSDLEFTVDQPILFKAFDEAGDLVGKYALIDLGYGTVDTISMEQTRKLGIARFVYFYDVSSRKSVNITFEGELPGSVGSPTIIETKGPLPIEFENGYVAFEDLPDDRRRIPGEQSTLAGFLGDLDDDDLDDEDDDEDGEDEDVEEEEIIYDAEE
ncbi:MAG: hypothetical protein K6D54_04040 [Bacteroidales bacterium]|nr:hypothetical protein [Bacteroidales bacterium]